jgi:hypothetical protein
MTEIDAAVRHGLVGWEGSRLRHRVRIPDEAHEKWRTGRQRDRVAKAQGAHPAGGSENRTVPGGVAPGLQVKRKLDFDGELVVDGRVDLHHHAGVVGGGMEDRFEGDSGVAGSVPAETGTRRFRRNFPAGSAVYRSGR